MTNENPHRYPALSYVREKLMGAVLDLAVSSESPQRKLAAAYDSHIVLALDEIGEHGSKRVPDSIAEGLWTLEGHMDAIKVEDEKNGGRWETIESDMDELQAVQLIKKIVELDHSAARELFGPSDFSSVA